MFAIVYTKNFKKNDAELVLYLISALCFIYRSAIPILKYPFLVIFPILLIYQIISYHRKISFQSIITFFRTFYLPLILVFISTIAFLSTNFLQLSIFIELFSNYIVVTLFISLSFIVSEKKDISKFNKTFLDVTLIFSIILAISQIISLILPKTISKIYLLGDNEYIDYNFSLIPVFYGLIYTLQLNEKNKPKYNWNHLLLLILFSITIIISGSRRGIILLICIVLFLIFQIICKRWIKKFLLLFNTKLYKYYIISVVLVLVSIYITIFKIDSNSKNSFLFKIFPKQSTLTKQLITQKIYHYSSILSNDIDYNTLYDRLWKSNYDPKKPESGWMSEYYKPVFPIDGNSSEIVPYGSVGCLFDKETTADDWNGNAYFYSKIKSIKVEKGDSVYFSIYNYTSDEFDGDWAKLHITGGVFLSDQFIELNVRGKWQRTELKFLARESGMLDAYIYFSKRNQTNFDSLKGNIVFAYPELETVKVNYDTIDPIYRKILNLEFDPIHPETGWNPNNYKISNLALGKRQEELPRNAKAIVFDSSCYSSYWKESINLYSEIDNIEFSYGDSLFFSAYCYISEDFDGNNVFIRTEGDHVTSGHFDINLRNQWQKVEIKELLRESGRLKGYFFATKLDDNKNNSFKGFVQFAYPKIKVLSNSKFLSNPVFKNILDRKFDSRHPETGWGKRIYKLVPPPLKGRSSNIVPDDAFGYMMDRTTNASTWSNNAYSYSQVKDINIKKGDSLFFSAYCFVSQDFDGNWARLRTEGVININSEYDFSKKGQWQYLELKTICNKDGQVHCYLYWAKEGTTSFNKLKGHIIFAYPEIKILSEGSQSQSQQVIHEQPDRYQYISPNFLSNADPIRKLISKLFKTDTLFVNETFFLPDKEKSEFIDSRYVRWKFAFQLLNKKYTFKQKIFGDGYNYITYYGHAFYDNKDNIDYPHNPILSVLLYSGLIGVVIYFCFIVFQLILYIKYFKKTKIFFAFYLIAYYFSFFSANNPLDPPIMGFFSLYIFFIHFKMKSLRTKSTI